MHELFVDRETTSGVDDDDVVHLLLRELNARLGHLYRIADAIPRFRRKRHDAGAFTDDAQLVNRVRPLQVRSDEYRRVALALEMQREFARECRLTGTLQTDEHQYCRRLLREPESAGFATKDFNEFLVHDLHDRLRRIQRPGEIDLGSTRPDALGERLDRRQSDVRVEQGGPDLLDRPINVGRGQLAATTQRLERGT